MKKNFLYAMMSAIALTGAVGLAACSSNEEAAEENPNYNPKTNSVTTQFVLNVAYAQPNPTRQSSATVQKNNNFRGMQDTKLIALRTGKSSWLAPFDGSSTAGTDYVKRTFSLGTLYTQSTTSNPAPSGSNNSHRVLQLELPIYSDAMLVYARAIPSGDVEEDGKVTVSINENPEESTFSLVSRIGNKNDEYNQTLNLAALILNRIMLSSVEATTGAYTYNSGQPNTYTSSGALAAVTWKTITDPGNGLPHLLKEAYNRMKVKSGEYRNGSSKGLRDQVLDIYKTTDAVLRATSTNDNEVNAQRLAYEIKSRIDKYFSINIVSNPNTISFNSKGTSKTASGTIMYALCGGSPAIVEEATFNSSYSLVSDDDLAGFPTCFGIPEGAALLKQNTDDSYAYKNTSADTDNSLIGQSGYMSPDKYMYPAELLYFDNSALYVSEAEKKEGDYPNGYTTWDGYNWTSNAWTQGAVSSSTKAVAVKSNINYGVAMLEATVGFGTLGNSESYVDNRNDITGEANQTFSTAEMGNFILTGVLIGNQYNQLGWNYLMKTGSTNDYVIYDKNINSGFTVGGTTPNYTLVFDNWASGGTQTSDVYVALEFQNNAKAFYGNKNLIPYGGKFYLVGKLTLANGTNTSFSWDSNYATPPYTSGNTTDTKRVFIQNYVTKAVFNIGATSLQKAFLTVPDLRSTQMSLGLSVDISWKEGLTFTSTLGN